MYAIIETGGKQEKAVPGELLKVERIDAPVGEKIQFDKVLLLSGEGEVKLGNPYIDGASVSATVTEQSRARKIRVFKMKRRKHYRRTRGHRQAFTAVRVDTIEG